MASSPKYLLEPRTQLANLGRDRLLVRHHLGVGVLHGLQIDELVNRLGYFNGDSLEDILTASPYHEDDVRAIVARLRGSVLVEREIKPLDATVPPASRLDASVLILGNGSLGKMLFDCGSEIYAPGFLSLDMVRENFGVPNPGYRDFLNVPDVIGINGAALKGAISGCRGLVCALEGVALKIWKQVQAIALDVGVPFLPVRVEPDGLRLGPVNAPGHSACLDCALKSQMRFLGTWQPVLDELRTVLLSGTLPSAFHTLYIEELNCLFHQKPSQLLDRVVHFGPRGGRTNIDWDRACHTCGVYSPDGSGASRRSLWFQTAARRVTSFESDREQIQTSSIAKEVESIAKTFDWHSQVTIFFIEGDGGAGWNRSRRTITVYSQYVERFIKQGASLAK